MWNADKGQAQALDGTGLRIGIVQSRFNQGITDNLALACKEELVACGVSASDITHYQVPGALEVPMALQAMARRGGFDALIALGCVIRGETYHFELVCNESAAGITRIGLDHGIPIANAIITTENLPQAVARQQEKGCDAARVAIEMVRLLQICETA